MSYEIREMNFGEILDVGFSLIRNHFVLLIMITGTVYIPVGAASYLVQSDPELILSPVGMTLALVLTLLSLVVYPVVSVAMTHAISELYLDREVTFGDAFGTGFKLLLPVLGTSILAGLIVLVGFFFLIIPGIYLQLCFLLIAQVMVIERTFGTEALGRSRELMGENLLRGLGLLVIAMVISSVLQFALGMVLAFFPLLAALGSGFAQAVTFAFTTAVTVVFYFDIRCRKESFDLEHLAQLVETKADNMPDLPKPL